MRSCRDDVVWGDLWPSFDRLRFGLRSVVNAAKACAGDRARWRSAWTPAALAVIRPRKARWSATAASRTSAEAGENSIWKTWLTP